MSHYTEEEQIAQIKDWWQRNGKPLMVGVIVALVLVLGWQGWQKKQARQGEQLSVLYQQLLEAGFNRDTPELGEVSRLLQSLQEIAPEHAYTQYARLIVARLAVNEGRLDDAGLELAKVVDKPANSTLAELAQQRLARVLAAQNKANEALELLAANGVAAYQASRDELRGDILLQLGREAEARAAYEQARQSQSDSQPGGMLMMKLDSLAQKDA